MSTATTTAEDLEFCPAIPAAIFNAARDSKLNKRGHAVMYAVEHLLDEIGQMNNAKTRRKLTAELKQAAEDDPSTTIEDLLRLLLSSDAIEWVLLNFLSELQMALIRPQRPQVREEVPCALKSR